MATGWGLHGRKTTLGIKAVQCNPLAGLKLIAKAATAALLRPVIILKLLFRLM